MGTPHKPLPVKLIVGLIGQDLAILKRTENMLRRSFGKTDYESPVFAFDKTSYYEKEMGPALRRKFLSYARLISPEKLPAIKIVTNALEKKVRYLPGKRAVNIDPGYISLSKLVLATTKSFTHRLYMGRGIFEEVTLYFKDHTFEPGRWTYPDYRAENHIAAFNDIRRLYLEQLTKTYGPSELYRCV